MCPNRQAFLLVNIVLERVANPQPPVAARLPNFLTRLPTELTEGTWDLVFYMIYAIQYWLGLGVLMIHKRWRYR